MIVGTSAWNNHPEASVDLCSHVKPSTVPTSKCSRMQVNAGAETAVSSEVVYGLTELAKWNLFVHVSFSGRLWPKKETAKVAACGPR